VCSSDLFKIFSYFLRHFWRSSLRDGVVEDDLFDLLQFVVELLSIESDYFYLKIVSVAGFGDVSEGREAVVVSAAAGRAGGAIEAAETVCESFQE
jgi:hypothetical protein